MLKNSLKPAAILAFALAGVSSAAVLATLRANAPAYPSQTRRVFEKPVFHTDKGDVVEIVRWGLPLAQVRTKTGRLGWIESVRLDTVNIPAVLSISKPVAKAGKLSAADDSALAKRWLDAQKASTPAPTVVPEVIKADSVAPAATIPEVTNIAPTAPAVMIPDAPKATPAMQKATTP